MGHALSVPWGAGVQSYNGQPNRTGLLIPMSNLSNIAVIACGVIEPGVRHFVNGAMHIMELVYN